MENKTVTLLFSGKAKKRTAASFYDFSPESSFYYFTGIDREDTAVVMHKKGNDVKEVFFAPKADKILEKWIGKNLTADEIKSISGIEEIFDINDLYKYVKLTADKNKTEKLYTTYDESENIFDMDISRIFSAEIKNDSSINNIKNISYEIGEIRKIKSDFEVKRIIESLEISKQAILYMLKNIKPGMMEYEIESYYNFAVKNKGADASFKSIVASGENAVILHYTNNTKKTKRGELVLCNFGDIKKYYFSDITRTIPVDGKFTNRQKQLYEIVLKTNKEIISLSRPGISLVQLNQRAKEILYTYLKKINMLEEFSELDKYYYHNVSHFLGLDVHDCGDREKPLKPGCIITVEPGIYVTDEKTGIRIEDNVLITEGEAVVLSDEIPKEIHEIERIMGIK